MSETSLRELARRARRRLRPRDGREKWLLRFAQGVLPVGLMGGRDDLEIIKGAAYYQSYICHIPRSTIELGLNGSLDCLDGMLFPAICDVIRNLSGMWQMLFPDKLEPAEFGTKLCK